MAQDSPNKVPRWPLGAFLGLSWALMGLFWMVLDSKNIEETYGFLKFCGCRFLVPSRSPWLFWFLLSRTCKSHFEITSPIITRLYIITLVVNQLIHCLRRPTLIFSIYFFRGKIELAFGFGSFLEKRK